MAIKCLVPLGGLIISCSKFHSDIFFNSLSCIRVISFLFSIPYVIFYLHANAHLRHSSSSLVSSRPMIQPDKVRSQHNHIPIIQVLLS